MENLRFVLIFDFAHCRYDGRHVWRPYIFAKCTVRREQALAYNCKKQKKPTHPFNRVCGLIAIKPTR